MHSVFLRIKRRIVFWSILTLIGLKLFLIKYNFAFNLWKLRVDFIDSSDRVKNDNVTKLILHWTTWFGEPFKLHFLDNCLDNCRLTNDRNLLDQASAVVFHMRNVNWYDIPTRRFSHQRYVFQNQESPPMTYINVDTIPNFFNWTMTYRLDSDIPLLYGFFKPKNPDKNFTYSLNISAILSQNKKLVVWMASHCRTPGKRELYVEKLKKYLPIDVYGKCGKLHCPVKDDFDRSMCNRMIGENYKFYLAFENSICKDYITEKFYHRADLNSVPVVLKRTIVENVLPKNSFIAADDFENAQQLAQYLIELSNNDTLYLSYFKWKISKYKSMIVETDTFNQSYCNLCKKLWNTEEPQKSYKKMSTWWTDGMCTDVMKVKNLNND